MSLEAVFSALFGWLILHEAMEGTEIVGSILMFIAVDGFKNNPHEVGKYIGIFLGVTVFILCGFEHCVANMFYFSAANAWSGKALLYLLVMTLGNTCGGVSIPLCRMAKRRAEAN